MSEFATGYAAANRDRKRYGKAHVVAVVSMIDRSKVISWFEYGYCVSASRARWTA